jgi:hypothetical protein
VNPVFSVPRVVAMLLQLAALLRRVHPSYPACEDRPLRDWLLLVRSFVEGALAEPGNALRLTADRWSRLDVTVAPRLRHGNTAGRCCATAECTAVFWMSGALTDLQLLSRTMRSAEMVEALEQAAFVLSREDQAKRYGAGLCIHGWSVALYDALLLTASSVRDAASSKDAASRTELGTACKMDTKNDGGASSPLAALDGAL